MNPTIKELINKIKNQGGLKEIDLGELIRPENYAYKISKDLKLTRVQLRKVYTEFKNIYDIYKKTKGKDENEIKTRLYKLYPILQYQVNRKLIDNDFKELIWEILNSLDKNLENFENTMEFIKALVAYSKE